MTKAEERNRRQVGATKGLAVDWADVEGMRPEQVYVKMSDKSLHPERPIEVAAWVGRPRSWSRCC